jgi:hypothetical protein
MTDELDERIAARVRAALAYAALTYEEAADLIADMGSSTLRRITSPKNPRGAALHELSRIAVACDVPLDWLTSGQWDDGGEPLASLFPELGVGTQQQRLDVLEHYVEQLLVLERSRGQMPAPLLDGDDVLKLTDAQRTHEALRASLSRSDAQTT